METGNLVNFFKKISFQSLESKLIAA